MGTVRTTGLLLHARPRRHPPPLTPAGAKPDASTWVAALAAKVSAAREKLTAKLAKTAFPLDYHTTLGEWVASCARCAVNYAAGTPGLGLPWACAYLAGVFHYRWGLLAVVGGYQ